MTVIGLGGPDLVGRLDQISDQLVQVQKSLDKLTAMTAEILKQLAELKDFMDETLQLQVLYQAMDRINTAYGKPSRQASLQEYTQTPDLRVLLEKMPRMAGMTDRELKAAAQKFAAWVRDVRDCIATIHRVLTQSAHGQTSLIQHWVNGLV